MTEQVGLPVPPLWRQVRLGVNGVDTAPYTSANMGVADPALITAIAPNGSGYRWGLYRFRVASGTVVGSSITLQPVFWDEVGGVFAPDPSVGTQVFAASAGNVPGQTKFDLRGRTFTIVVTARTGDIVVDIDVAAFGGPNSRGLLD